LAATKRVTEHQRLFLAQARADFVVFRLLQARAELPACHALHYLQMATELLGKAHAWRRAPQPMTHVAFVPFLRSLTEQQIGLAVEQRNDFALANLRVREELLRLAAERKLLALPGVAAFRHEHR